MRWGLAAAADIPLEFASSITARYPGAGSHSSATAPIVVDGFADSPLERDGFELPVPGFSRAFFSHRSGACSCKGPGSHSRVLTTDNGRWRWARLAPAMISTPGHRASEGANA